MSENRHLYLADDYVVRGLPTKKIAECVHLMLPSWKAVALHRSNAERRFLLFQGNFLKIAFAHPLGTWLEIDGIGMTAFQRQKGAYCATLKWFVLRQDLNTN